MKYIIIVIIILVAVYLVTAEPNSSPIGKTIIANRLQGVGVWGSPSLTSTLVKTYFPGEKMGVVVDVEKVGTDEWFIVDTGYVHNVPSNFILK